MKKIAAALATIGATMLALAPAADAQSLPSGIELLTASVGSIVPHYTNKEVSSTLLRPDAWIVSLGARLNKDCTMPGVLKERLDKTAEVALAYPLNPVLVTGGKTQSACPSEAAAMKAGLVARGVVPWRITTDTTALSTVGNAQAANKMIHYGGVVVTSANHLPRALNSCNTFNTYAPGKHWVGLPV